MNIYWFNIEPLIEKDHHSDCFHFVQVIMFSTRQTKKENWITLKEEKKHSQNWMGIIQHGNWKCNWRNKMEQFMEIDKNRLSIFYRRFSVSFILSTVSKNRMHKHFMENVIIICQYWHSTRANRELIQFRL